MSRREVRRRHTTHTSKRWEDFLTESLQGGVDLECSPDVRGVARDVPQRTLARACRVPHGIDYTFSGPAGRLLQSSASFSTNPSGPPRAGTFGLRRHATGRRRRRSRGSSW